MKIGLMRHFKVNLPYKNIITTEEFKNWICKYDEAELCDYHNCIIDQCYSSDLYRAIETAKHIYKDRLRETSLLREIPMSPITNKNIRLHRLIWMISSRIAWRLNHKSQSEGYRDTEKRIRRFINEIITLQTDSILIVTHGYIMRLLKKELKIQGFKGPKFIKPINGKLYMFERLK